MNSIESTDSIKRAVYWFLVIFILKTRMHSSRRRTTRYSGHPGVLWICQGCLLRRGVCAGGCLPRWGYLPIWGYPPIWGYLPRGVCTGECLSKGCLPRRGCLPGGGCLSRRGCLPRKGVSAQGVYHTPHEQND